MTITQLSKQSGVSIGFLSQLIVGKCNPSLKTMVAIARGLDVPLVSLLEETDLDKNVIESLTKNQNFKSLPEGYERATVVLPKFQAFIANQWHQKAQQKIKQITKET